MKFDELMKLAKNLEANLETEWAEEHADHYEQFDEIINEEYDNGNITAWQFNKLAHTAFYDYPEIKEEETMKTLGQISEIINEAERMSKAYFFRAPSSAGARRSYEKYHSHEEVTWTEGGHEYTARYEVSCSCANVYAKGYYTKDGKPTTLTAIRNSYKRMAQ